MKAHPLHEQDGAPIARGIHHGRVEWIDTDAAGIHHNTSIVRYVESAEAALMRSRGLQKSYFPQTPRVRYEVDYLAPLRPGQELTAVVDLITMGTTSMTFAFEVWGEKFEGRPRRRVAAGRFVTVHVSGDHTADAPARSSPWPAAWVRALGSPLSPSVGAVDAAVGAPAASEVAER